MCQEVRYPKQIYAIKRSKKTLAVDAELYLPNTSDGENPLEMHCNYSRFVITLIDKEGPNTISPWANVPAYDIDYIKRKTDIALESLTLDEPVEISSDNTNLSSAYTQKILIGYFKGRTPAAILLEDRGQAEELLKTRDYLLKNADRYVANKNQANAITEAIELMEKGLLRKQEENLGKFIKIYETEFKPLRQTDHEGFRPAYKISITCNTAMKYPFNIEITNCKVPVRDNVVILSQAKDVKKSNILVTDKEWYTFISRMQRTLDNFELINYKKQFEYAWALNEIGFLKRAGRDKNYVYECGNYSAAEVQQLEAYWD